MLSPSATTVNEDGMTVTLIAEQISGIKSMCWQNNFLKERYSTEYFNKK